LPTLSKDLPGLSLANSDSARVAVSSNMSASGFQSPNREVECQNRARAAEHATTHVDSLGNKKLLRSFIFLPRLPDLALQDSG
jgi:hypothetical protein